jgi:predicted transcriptional regulator
MRDPADHFASGLAREGHEEHASGSSSIYRIGRRALNFNAAKHQKDSVMADLKTLTADIVASFVEKNPLRASELGSFVRAVYGALAGANAPVVALEPEPIKRITPAQVRKSIALEAITCFACGKSYKTLRRHLLAEHGQTPGGYIAAWGLPLDYPMVSEATSKMRSDFAKSIGLGKPAALAPPKAKPSRKPRLTKAVDPAEETFI